MLKCEGGVALFENVSSKLYHNPLRRRLRPTAAIAPPLRAYVTSLCQPTSAQGPE
jgi:hypothetical protein